MKQIKFNETSSIDEESLILFNRETGKLEIDVVKLYEEYYKK